ncbi:MAG: heterodisulfide reductase subunit [Actinomycetota bacterium]|nr:heterodisulfide reductase subunit [Actinomycetota bacterium]
MRPPDSSVIPAPIPPPTSCYQCGKCTAGCPVADLVDLMPHQVMGLLQAGEVDAVLASEMIWRCVACHQCSDRCPKNADPAGLMDACRALSVRRGTAAPGVRRTVLFQREFLAGIRRDGRVGELGLIARFKTKALARDGSVPRLLQDAPLAPRLLARRRLSLTGDRVRDRALVARIVDRSLREDQ